jgi:phosphoribosylaminoimidazole carboxylase PurE protein
MKIEVIIGSETDRPILAAKQVVDVTKAIRAAGVELRFSDCSAHRAPVQLTEFCSTHLQTADVIICAASMAAALPGAVAANMKFRTPVIAVPLPSDGFPDAMDALMASYRMPPGCPVPVVCGMFNALLAAWMLVGAMSDDVEIKKAYDAYMDALAKKKEPHFRISDDDIAASVAPKKP